MNGAYKSLVAQLGLSALTLVTTIIIARLAGAEGFGIYTLVFTWISVLGMAAVFGVDDLLLKIIPVHKSKEEKALLKGGVLWGNQLVLLIGGSLTLIFALLVNFSDLKVLNNYAYYYNLSLPVILLFALLHVNQATLRATGQFGIGQLAEKIIQPLAFVLCLTLTYILGAEVLDIDVVLYRTLSFGTAALVALCLMWRYFYQQHKQEQILYKRLEWTKSCFYFALISTLYLLNTRLDVLFLGLFETDAREIAYYNVAVKFTDLISIPFLVVATVTMPMFAELYANKQTEKLQHLYTRVTQLVSVVVLLGGTLLGIFGNFFLSWYGANFQEGYTVLLILILVKWIHALVGPANLLLMMIGFEKQVTSVLAVSVLSTCLFHYYLIPIEGMEGAAWASLIGLSLFECGVIWVAYQKAGIRTNIFGKW